MKRITTKGIALLFIGMCCLSGSAAFGQFAAVYTGANQQDDGRVEYNLFRGDTLLFENSIDDDALLLPEGKRFGISARSVFSGNMILFYAPVSLAIAGGFEISFSIPYQMRGFTDSNDDDFSKWGFGDLNIGGSYFHRFTGILDSVSTVRVVVPTGDEVASALSDDGSDTATVSLGSGCYSFSFLQSVSRKFESLPLRLYGNIGLILPTRMSIEYSDREVTIDRGNTLSMMVGADYILNESFTFLCKLNFINVFEGSREVRYDNNSLPQELVDLNDSVTAMDLIPGARYHFLENYSLMLMIIIPMIESQDEDLNNPSRRGWKIAAHFEAVF
ncbi:MAG: hypothetical protein GY754_23380 [bacterium]|nr:hypothetical protein [bacterium]